MKQVKAGPVSLPFKLSLYKTGRAVEIRVGDRQFSAGRYISCRLYRTGLRSGALLASLDIPPPDLIHHSHRELVDTIEDHLCARTYDLQSLKRAMLDEKG